MTIKLWTPLALFFALDAPQTIGRQSQKHPSNRSRWVVQDFQKHPPAPVGCPGIFRSTHRLPLSGPGFSGAPTGSRWVFRGFQTHSTAPVRCSGISRQTQRLPLSASGNFSPLKNRVQEPSKTSKQLICNELQRTKAAPKRPKTRAFRGAKSGGQRSSVAQPKARRTLGHRPADPQLQA